MSVSVIPDYLAKYCQLRNCYHESLEFINKGCGDFDIKHSLQCAIELVDAVLVQLNQDIENLETLSKATITLIDKLFQFLADQRNTLATLDVDATQIVDKTTEAFDYGIYQPTKNCCGKVMIRNLKRIVLAGTPSRGLNSLLVNP